MQRDDSESRASLDVVPGMSFTPDSKALVASWGGKLWRVPIDGRAPQAIPLEVDVQLAMAPPVQFEYAIPDSATFVVKQIRDAVPSPEGKRRLAKIEGFFGLKVNTEENDVAST